MMPGSKSWWAIILREDKGQNNLYGKQPWGFEGMETNTAGELYERRPVAKSGKTMLCSKKRLNALRRQPGYGFLHPGKDYQSNDGIVLQAFILDENMMLQSELDPVELTGLSVNKNYKLLRPSGQFIYEMTNENYYKKKINKGQTWKYEDCAYKLFKCNYIPATSPYENEE